MSRYVISGIALFVLYVASYVVLSSAGEYSPQPRGYIGRVVWCPKGLVSATAQERAAFTWLGYVYLPLIIVDWRVAHPPFQRC